MNRLFLLIAIAICHISFSTIQAENFPKPNSLQPDVNFWIQVYTLADTQSGYIHDSENLAVVYEKISIKGSPRANKKYIKQTKVKYVAVLKSLASGKRNNLSKDERHVLSLWGESVSSQRLKTAAKNLRFQRGQSDRFMRGLERSGEWRAYIESTLTQMSMPIELSVLPHVESSFNPEAYSHVGAAGIWQFIRSTGRRYMQIDHVVDERMDPFVSTVAAAKLLQHNYQLTKSWPLALTAYNHGVSSMRRAINKLGTRDIATIVRQYKGRSFGFASRNFYVAFLAALEVDSNTEKYFPPISFANEVDYEILNLDAYYFAKDISTYLNVNMSQLKRHNRALRDSVWSNTKRIPKGFALRIPKVLLPNSAKDLLAQLPKEFKYNEQTPDEFHLVQRGDTISEIASEYGYKVKDVLAANNLAKGHYIRAGQKLRLPVNGIEVVSKVDLASIDKDLSQIQLERSTPSKELSETVNDVDDSESSMTQSNAAITQEDVDQNETVIDLDVSVVAAPEIEDSELPLLLSDPADYTVDQNNTIEVHASETLGHYAEWLDIRASQLREINSMQFGEPVVMGKRVKLDFSEIGRDKFEQRRIQFQRRLQGDFFNKYRIDSTSQHKIKRGESVWVLALRKFKVPIWLLHQHNPDVDFNRIKPGTQIIVPVLSLSKDPA